MRVRIIEVGEPRFRVSLPRRASATRSSGCCSLPTTPLYDRLKRDGRLNSPADSDRFGTNVVPLRLKSAELRDGFAEVMQMVYSADSYFQRSTRCSSTGD